jgi:hypothetical protein
MSRRARSLREPSGERTVVLPQGSVFTVPRGTEHKPYAPARAAILVLEPTGTLSADDHRDEIPDHMDATNGACAGLNTGPPKLSTSSSAVVHRPVREVFHRLASGRRASGTLDP